MEDHVMAESLESISIREKLKYEREQRLAKLKMERDEKKALQIMIAFHDILSNCCRIVHIRNGCPGIGCNEHCEQVFGNDNDEYPLTLPPEYKLAWKTMDKKADILGDVDYIVKYDYANGEVEQAMTARWFYKRVYKVGSIDCRCGRIDCCVLARNKPMEERTCSDIYNDLTWAYNDDDGCEDRWLFVSHKGFVVGNSDCNDN